MPDPITIIGATGAVANIIDVIGKTINGLRELHSRWKEVDFTFINLIAQLTALKAAVNKIQEWMESDVVEPHHQLVMDLEASISCCRMLIDKIDSQVSELRQKADYTLEFQSKMTLIMKSGILEELQKMVERQTNALTLLLSACNLTAISEQKTLLEKAATRKIFQRIRDDSSSLYVQRDSSSLSSRWTDNLSRISKVFDFDRELFVSKVYENALRNSLRDTAQKLRRRSSLDKSSVEDIIRSKVIDRELEQDCRRLQREVKVLLLGNPECGQSILNDMRIDHGYYTAEVLASYKGMVISTVAYVMKAMVFVIRASDIGLDESTERHTELLSQEMGKEPTDEAQISLVAANAAQGLWARQDIRSIFLQSTDVNVDIPKSALYFLEDVQRIVQKDYTPTVADILHAGPKFTGFEETKLSKNHLSLSITHILGRSEREKWMSHFADSHFVIFVVDLTCYDKVSLNHQNETTKMTESLLFFDSIVNSQWFTHTSIILLLCNYDLFRQKLSYSSLTNYFPGYGGGNNVNSASEYILRRYKKSNRSKSAIYSQFMDASEPSNSRVVWRVIQRIITEQNVKRLSGGIG